MILQLVYEPLSHPYADEASSKNEVWANIKLQILDSSGTVIKVVFNLQWDIIVILNWFIKNKEALINEDVPQEISGSSIAEGVYDFYEHLDTELEKDEILDKIFAYRTRHEIGFALKGVEVSDVFIGKRNNSETISFFDGENNWNYNINIQEFLLQIRKIYAEIERNTKRSFLSPPNGN